MVIEQFVFGIDVIFVYWDYGMSGLINHNYGSTAIYKLNQPILNTWKTVYPSKTSSM